MLDIAVIVFALMSLSLVIVIPVGLFFGIRFFINDRPYREAKRMNRIRKKEEDERYRNFLLEYKIIQ